MGNLLASDAAGFIPRSKMTRAKTWLASATVCAVALAAVADEIRRGPDEGRSQSERAADRLRAARLTGILVISGRDCRLRAVRLPALSELTIDEGRACRFSIARDARLTIGDALPQPGGPFRVWCRDGWVELAARSGSSLPFTRLYRLRGCGPAWRPSGGLTYVRDGELVELRMRCGGGGFCTRVLLSAGDLRRSFGAASLVEVAWLDDETLAAIVREEARRRYAVATFERGRPRHVVRFGAERIAEIRPSPRGTYLAVRRGEGGRLVLLGRSLQPVPLTARLRAAHAIAWSPDEGWLAAAVEEGLFLSRVGAEDPDPIRVPLEAVHVAWHGGAIEPYPLQGSS
jgi:hypothetical protein